MNLEQVSEAQVDQLGEHHLIRTARQTWIGLGGKDTDNASEMLSRLMKRCPDFPRPRCLGKNGRGWIFLWDEVEAWVRAQPAIDSVRTRARGLR